MVFGGHREDRRRQRRGASRAGGAARAERREGARREGGGYEGVHRATAGGARGGYDCESVASSQYQCRQSYFISFGWPLLGST